MPEVLRQLMTNDDPIHDRAERIATSIRDRVDDDESRRSFLTKSVLAGGALAGITGLTVADEHEGEDGGNESGNESMGEKPPEAAFDDVLGTDVDVLNYALTLEHLEDAFYEESLEMFSEEDFMNAEALQSFPEETRTAAYGYVETVAEHEATHVQVLTQVVELLGATPVERGMYEFGVETVGDMIGLAQTLENTGVAAYAGAAPFIESPDLLGAALSIHSVEARHAAVVNYLGGTSPFPAAFDESATQDEVLAAVEPLIVSMPDEPGHGNGSDPNGSDGGMGGNESDEN